MNPDQLAVKQEFDRLINMTAAEMTAHYATPESDYASLPAAVAKKLKQTSGRTMGKSALALKCKAAWTEDDFTAAQECSSSIKRFLGRKVAYKTAEGAWTPFAIALLNRGHNPMKATPVSHYVSGAAEGELSDTGKRKIVDHAVTEALRAMMGGEFPDGGYPWVREIYSESAYVILEWMGSMYRLPYQLVGTECTVDTSQIEEVTMEYVPVTEADLCGVVLEVTEARAGKGPTWGGIMIRAGLAKNRAPNGMQRDYTEEALIAAVDAGLFDGVPGYDRTDAEHQKRAEADVVGYWGKAVWDKATKAVKNTFTWLEGKLPKAVNAKAGAAVAEGKTSDVPGFSIVADILAPKGKPHIVAAIERVLSCDPVGSPSAGGVVLTVTESHITKEKQMKFLEALKKLGLSVPPKLAQEWDTVEVAEGAESAEMIARLKEKRPKLFEAGDLEQKLSSDDAMRTALFAEFLVAESAVPAPAKPDPTPAPAPAEPKPNPEIERAQMILQQASEATARMNKHALEGMLAASGLSEHGKRLVRDKFSGQPFDEQKVQESITQTKDLLAEIRQAMMPRHLVVSGGADQADKVATAWSDMFFSDIRDPQQRQSVAESAEGQIGARGKALAPVSKHVGREILSVKRLAEMTLGHPIDWGDAQQVQEAMDSVVSNAHLVNGMNLRIAYEFQTESEYSDMFKICNVVNISDMKTKNTLATGGMSGWAAKHSSTGFPTLTASGAAKESYTPAEYGGIHTITWIEFVNDDTGYFQRIPKTIGQEALFFMNDFFWGTLVADNPTLTDTAAVFTDDRGNYMNTALDDASLTEAIGKLQQVQHPGHTTGRPRMTRAKYLAVTGANIAMQKKAYELLTPAYGLQNPVAGFTQSRGLQVIVNPVATDPNDWWVFGADPGGIVEIGVYGGRIEPRIIVANDPGAGYYFSNNYIQIKGEQDYGGNWVTPKNALWSHVAD